MQRLPSLTKFEQETFTKFWKLSKVCDASKYIKKTKYLAHYLTVQMIQKHKIKTRNISKIVVYKQNSVTSA